MSIEETLTELLAREARLATPVPDLLERVRRQRDRRSARIRALAAGTLVVLVALGVSLAVERTRPTATPAPAAASTSPTPSATGSLAAANDIVGVWLPIYIWPTPRDGLAQADKQRVTIGPTWITTVDTRCGTTSGAWTYVRNDRAALRLSPQSVVAVGCSLTGGVILNSGVIERASTIQVRNGILEVTDRKDGTLIGRYRRVPGSGEPSTSESPSRPGAALTVNNQRLILPFVYPGSSLSLSPVPAGYTPKVSAAEAVAAFEQSDFAKGEAGRTPLQFLAEIKLPDGIHTKAVWVFRFTGIPAPLCACPARIGPAQPSGSSTTQNSAPRPSMTLTDELVIIDATTGEVLSLNTEGAVPTAS